MDYNGFLSIEFMFYIFLILILSIGFLFLVDMTIQSNIKESINVDSRLFLDSVANLINQVSSNGEGYSKEFILPNSIGSNSYLLIIKSNEVVLEFSNKKAKSIIFPISLVDNEELSISQLKFYHGETYLVEKMGNNKIRIIKE